MSLLLNIARNSAAASLRRSCRYPTTRVVNSTVVRSRSAAPAVESSAAASAETAAASESSVPVAQSLLAAVVGVCTVSGVAGAVEYATAGSVPPFDPNSQRFDQTNFSGRFCRMLLLCDPRLVLYSEEEVRRCQAMVQDHANLQGKTQDMDHALWEARRISESALHPDTGDWVPRPFRMSGYVPFNGPIAVAMVASRTTPALLFWAWINQSHNALINYYNRNASSTMTNETLMKSYAGAVGSALAVAFGLATFIQKRFEPSKAKALLRWVAFPSSVAASSLNCYIVRSPEMDTGIPLMNGVGQDVLEGETSKEAAKRGVYTTTASRAMLQAPVYMVPPLLLSFGPLKRFVCVKNPAAVVPVTTYLLLVCFGVGLPATVAVFPQISKLDANEAEPKFQHLRDPRTNKPYEVFYYNKGL